MTAVNRGLPLAMWDLPQDVVAAFRQDATAAALGPPARGPWLVESNGLRFVLRRFPPHRYPAETSADHIAWLHAYLSGLEIAGVDIPRPVAFDGGSDTVIEAAGALWEKMTYVPGDVIGWSSGRLLRSVGALLATYHLGARELPAQRPDALPLHECWPECCRRQTGVVHASLEQLAAPILFRCVVHGDPTAFNVVVRQGSSQATGLLDFTLAYIDDALVDLAFCLARSGRPDQASTEYDVERISEVVAGYLSVMPLPPTAARAIPVYLQARRLQLLVRHERFRPNLDLGPSLQMLDWLITNQPMLETAIAQVIS